MSLVCDGQTIQVNPNGGPFKGRLTADQTTPGSPASFAISAQPANGRVVLLDAGTGDFTYAANAGFQGADSFQFTATDAAGNSWGPGTVNVNVQVL